MSQQGGLIKTLSSTTTLTQKMIQSTELFKLDATGGAFTVTLPQNLKDGLEARFYLIGSSTNIVTIDRNGNTIDGQTADQVLDSNRVKMSLIADAVANDWVKSSREGSGAAQRPVTIAASTPISQNSINSGLIIGDTSGGAVTATLPASPPEGTTCVFRRQGANDFILDRNGNTIDGGASNVTLDTDLDSVTIRFSLGDWKIINQRDLP